MSTEQSEATQPAPSFSLDEADFASALSRAAEEAGVSIPPDVHAKCPISLQEAGEKLGLDKLKVQQALHRVSMEKLPEDIRKKMGIVLDDEVPLPPKRWWVSVVLFLSIIALGIAGWALFIKAPKTRPQVQLQAQKGEIDVAALHSALDVLGVQSQTCYQKGLKKDPKLLGKVVLTLRIDLAGKARAQLKKNDLRTGGENHEDTPAEVAECMRKAAEASEWPPAKMAAVDVDVPFAFSSQE